jgi:hypothetical protein
LHAGCWTGDTISVSRRYKVFILAAAQEIQGIHLFIAKKFLTAVAQTQGIHFFIAK